MELFSVLFGSLHGMVVFGKMNTYIFMADTPHSSTEIIIALLIGSTPIQNKKFEKKQTNKQRAQDYRPKKPLMCLLMSRTSERGAEQEGLCGGDDVIVPFQGMEAGHPRLSPHCRSCTTCYLGASTLPCWAGRSFCVLPPGVFSWRRCICKL